MDKDNLGNFLTGVDIVVEECSAQRGWPVVVHRDGEYGGSGEPNLVRRIEFRLPKEHPSYKCEAEYFIEALPYLKKALDYALAEYATARSSIICAWLVAEFESGPLPTHHEHIHPSDDTAPTLLILLAALVEYITASATDERRWLGGISVCVERV